MDGPRSLGPKDPRRFDYNSATTVVLRLLTPSSSREGARVTSLLISRMFSTTEEDLWFSLTDGGRSPISSTTAPLLIRPNLCIEVGKATCKKFSMRILLRSIFSSRNIFNAKKMTLAIVVWRYKTLKTLLLKNHSNLMDVSMENRSKNRMCVREGVKKYLDFWRTK